MRYWTRKVHLKYELSKRKEKLLIWFVYKLPKSWAYWSTIRVGAHATTGAYSNQVVPDLLFMDALKRWNDE